MVLFLRNSVLVGALALVTLASAQVNGLVTGIRAYGAGGDFADDHSQQLSDHVNPQLAGHAQANYSGAYGHATASVDVTAAYGDLSASLSAFARNNLNLSCYSVGDHYGGPSAEYYDRIFVNGANVGVTVTIHMTGLLTDLVRVDGNSNDPLNAPQGVEGYLNVGLAGGATSSLGVQSVRRGAVYTDNPSAAVDFTATVGSYFDLDGGLYAYATEYDERGPAVTSHTAITTGRFLTGLSASDPGVTFFGDSGHVYQAVPEPASLAALGLGALAVLRRRLRRA